MVTASRKQREIQNREAQILRLARPILLREGYQALTMERLAALMEYAKGTLYNHFPNKEEIVLALVIESMELRFKLFQAAAALSPTSRNRLMAIGVACELYTQDFSDHFAIEDWVRNATIWDKSSPKRHELIMQCESRCLNVVTGIVRDAVREGDLILRPGLSAEEMIFGFWSLNYGSQVLAATSPSLSSLGIPDAPRALRHHCCILMNGFDWKPFMEFEAHNASMDQIASQLKQQFAPI
jgi:AcrR family transcriptional regulator